MKLAAAVGDSFVTNRRRKILTLVEDTSGGRHDTLMAACDVERYGLLGVKGHHDNCRDNLHAALAELGLTVPATPSPLNLFMNIPWTPAGALAWAEPVSTPGSFVRFRAEMVRARGKDEQRAPKAGSRSDRRNDGRPVARAARHRCGLAAYIVVVVDAAALVRSAVHRTVGVAVGNERSDLETGAFADVQLCRSWQLAAREERGEEHAEG